MKLDYTLSTVKERVAFLKEHGENIKESAEKQGNYILLMDNKERGRSNPLEHPYKIETRWGDSSRAKRQVELNSVENILLSGPTLSRASLKLTEDQIKEIPECWELHQVANKLKEKMENAKGIEKWKLRHMVASLHSDKYAIWMSKHPTVVATKGNAKTGGYVPEGVVDQEYEMTFDLRDSKVVKAIMDSYHELDKQSRTNMDMAMVKAEFDELVEWAILLTPLQRRMLMYRKNGIMPVDIGTLEMMGGYENKGANYYSKLTSKVATKLAKLAKELYSIKHTERIKCTYCGKEYPAHPYFFCRKASASTGYSSRDKA